MSALLDAPDREHVLAGVALTPADGSCPACGRQLERRADGSDGRGLCRLHGYPAARRCEDPECVACPRGQATRCGLCGDPLHDHRDRDGQPVPACRWHTLSGVVDGFV